MSSVDLRVSYGLPVAGRKLELIADALNIQNRQSATAYEQSWSFTLRDNATATPGANPANAPNPDYQKALAWQAPREFRLGFRVRL